LVSVQGGIEELEELEELVRMGPMGVELALLAFEGEDELLTGMTIVVSVEVM
jgi:uncharacterized protein related to proFAR isomerase